MWAPAFVGGNTGGNILASTTAMTHLQSRIFGMRTLTIKSESLQSGWGLSQRTVTTLQELSTVMWKLSSLPALVAVYAVEPGSVKSIWPVNLPTRNAPPWPLLATPRPASAVSPPALIAQPDIGRADSAVV